MAVEELRGKSDFFLFLVFGSCSLMIATPILHYHAHPNSSTTPCICDSAKLAMVIILHIVDLIKYSYS